MPPPVGTSTAFPETCLAAGKRFEICSGKGSFLLATGYSALITARRSGVLADRRSPTGS